MEKKRLQLATKQGKRGITAESLSAAQPPATTALLEPGLKCQERTMHHDKLLSSNSCTANFQLYTQMALRLEENGVHAENGCRFRCLFGGETEGGKVAPPKKEAGVCEVHVPTIAHDQPSATISYGDLFLLLSYYVQTGENSSDTWRLAMNMLVIFCPFHGTLAKLVLQSFVPCPAVSG